MRRALLAAMTLALGAAFAALGGACGGGGGGGGGGGASDGGAVTPAVDGGGSTPQDLCPGGVAVDWPAGPYDVTILSTLPPDLAWEGPSGTVRIKDYFEPCAAESRLLVIRSSALWCGTCRWSATHTARLFADPRFASRVELLDLLLADEDNMPPSTDAAKRWLALIDAPGQVAIDPAYGMQTSLITKSALPEYVLVDTRTMQVRLSDANAAPEELQNRVVDTLALLDRQPRPDDAPNALYDGTLTEDQHALLADMKLTDTPPADPTNAYGDDAAAAALGKELFSDELLSPSGHVSCATCHDPTTHFVDGLGTSEGVAHGDRNAPTVVLSAFARWQFWDGRADTLWAQALGPPENDKEIASSRLFVAHQIADRYATEYGAVFGAQYPLPDLSDSTAFPAEGKPGDPAYDAMAPADKDAVTRVYVNAGKAIAAYERSLRVAPSALDGYAGGDTTALTAAEKHALQDFFVAGCAQCHWGPRLTDDAFHVIRMPTGRQDHQPDRGRADVLATLAAGEFVASSKWSDAPAAAKPLTFADPNVPSMVGAFKTPSLRGANATAPYGHGGVFVTLGEVTQHYGTRSTEVTDAQATGAFEPWLPMFDGNAQTDITALFDALSADPLP